MTPTTHINSRERRREKRVVRERDTAKYGELEEGGGRAVRRGRAPLSRGLSK